MPKQPVAVLMSAPTGSESTTESPRGSSSAAACCPPIAIQALTSEQASGIAPMFKALGDPVRLRLMSMIASQPEACVCDLSEAFDLSGPTISHHLKVLRENGLVDCERRGTWVYYWARPDALSQLGELLRISVTA